MTQSFFDAREALARPPAEAGEPMSVGDLTRRIAAAIKAGVPGSVRVRGELSNVSANRGSGHLYFTLKDNAGEGRSAAATIGGVMWKGQAARLRFAPKDGMEVIARGTLDLYPPHGKYQLKAESLEPVGEGALDLARRELWRKLKAEGLLEPSRKRPLPRYPRRIALVTSRQAAGYADMLKVLRRFGFLRLFLYHVPVQGAGAADKIAAALRHLDARHRDVGGIDLVLLGRGGGSLEDLWAFNEEPVARALADMVLPTITGIGHEVDLSVADLLADHKAHTPTEAAQVATQHWRNAAQTVDLARTQLRTAVRRAGQDARRRLTQIERHELFRRPTETVDRLRQRTDDLQRSLELAATRRLTRAGDRLNRLAATLADQHPRHRTALNRQRVGTLADRLDRAATRSLDRETARIAAAADRLTVAARTALDAARNRLDLLSARLTALSPLAVLDRGYSITTLAATGEIVRTPADAPPGTRLATRTAGGRVGSVVETDES